MVAEFGYAILDGELAAWVSGYFCTLGARDYLLEEVGLTEKVDCIARFWILLFSLFLKPFAEANL